MDQVNIGIIGVGARGGYLSEYWHSPGGRSIVTAVADTNPNYLAILRKM